MMVPKDDNPQARLSPADVGARLWGEVLYKGAFQIVRRG